ncbi:Ig-like domain-containing protein [Microbacterium wangruii]|uniref:Ig-like domain-containing protein n=1 Tax=Microbacterium wangruii TaxID=3049073 RepID=UPI00254C46B6|nr:MULTISPECIES: Ig-like domain-containing protein [unclassified Microbacterium]MDL5487135.1 Ig-like domain-containing protein [Microbacterium sp. zg-Y1211]WIM28201.1 Ig-like domain-containing protein [Microbacterium sp. zg-Y1090]
MLLSATLMSTLTVLAPVAAHADADGLAASPEITTVRFTDPAGVDWTPPAGVRRVSVTMAGGSGGDIVREGQSAPGSGRAGQLEFDLDVTPGETLRLYGATRGGAPHTQTPGIGYLNGGSGGSPAGGALHGGGGGGAAAVLRGTNLIAVAGGGGGVGGALKTAPTIPQPRPWRFGGAGGWGTSGADLAGEDGTFGYHPGKGGAPGTQTGTSGTNGSNAARLTASGGGGGGGAGWPSGTGGQSGKKFLSASVGGGGAGGTSYTNPDAENVRLLTSVNSDGYVEISYQNPVQLTLTAPTLFLAGVPQEAEVTVTGANGLVPSPGTVMFTADNTFVGRDSTVNGRVDFRFSLAQGRHTLKAEFTSRDRTQRASATLDVIVGPGPAHSLTILDQLPLRVPTASTVTVAGTVTTDGAALRGGEPITVAVNGHDTAGTVDAAGRFSIPVTAPSSIGAFTVQATFAGTTNIAASASAPVRMEAYDDQAVVTLTPTATTAVYGEPLAAAVTVRPADGAGVPATGIVLLTDGTQHIATATLDQAGTAAFSDLKLPTGVTQLTAMYGGDEVYNGADSAPATITVTTAATSTQLTAVSASGRAGDPVELDVAVAADTRSRLEPAGQVEILRDGEVVAVLSPGDDTDPTPYDGVSRFHTELTGTAAGTHAFTARYLPAAGFAASASAAQTVTLTAHATRLEATPAEVTITAGDTATLHAQVTAHAVGPLPPLDGAVSATLGGDVIGAPGTVDPNTGTADVHLTGLPVGTHSVLLTFHPDGVDYADATARVTVTVAPNVPTPADGGDTPAAGGDTPAAGGEGGGGGADRHQALAVSGQSASAWLTPLLTAGLLTTAGVLLLFRRRTRY